MTATIRTESVLTKTGNGSVELSDNTVTISREVYDYMVQLVQMSIEQNSFRLTKSVKQFLEAGK